MEDPKEKWRRINITGWWFGTWILFFHILGILIPTDQDFSVGLKPPTTLNRGWTIDDISTCALIAVSLINGIMGFIMFYRGWTIDVLFPLVGWLIDGFLFTPLTTGLFDDGIPNRPKPIFTKRTWIGQYTMVISISTSYKLAETSHGQRKKT